jgi:hypothetical protein
MRKLTGIMMLLVLFVLGQSCTDLLEQPEPSTSISEEVALSDPGAVEALRAQMYSRLHSFNYTTAYMIGPAALADELSNRPGTTRGLGYAENQRGTGMGTWGTSYNLINEANLIINEVGQDVFDSQATLDQYIAEALFMRAFAYHHLVRAYGYEPGMSPATGQGAGFDLGVVLRTQAAQSPEDASFRPRKTVSRIYSQIESDLQRAIGLFQSVGDAGNVQYATLAAAQALHARVSLYAGNYQDANDYAVDALNNTSASLATTQSGVANMFNETAGTNPEAIFLTVVNPSTESQGVNNALHAYTSTQWMAQVPTQDQLNMYDASGSDYRLAWFAECNNEDGGGDAGCLATHPSINSGNSPLEIQKWNGELGNYADNIPLLRVAEMYLILAEARLPSNGATGTGITATPLNDLRAARGLGTVTPSEQAILDERRREFVAEGQRFFDLKRLGRDISKAPATGAPEVPYTDFRILDNIPNGEVDLSEAEAPEDSVLIQNPGYEDN